MKKVLLTHTSLNSFIIQPESYGATVDEGFIVGGPVGDFELLLCHGTVCVVGKMRDLILQLSKSSIYSTKPDAVRKLKGAGINLAIDHFGAGFAGLSLLAQYQPDRIKIDHELIRNIHQDGPRQSIVQAIIKCCTSLEIAVSAVGVERAEEWMWLESAGISQFQGNLFASARLGGLPAVAWPEKK